MTTMTVVKFKIFIQLKYHCFLLFILLIVFYLMMSKDVYIIVLYCIVTM